MWSGAQVRYESHDHFQGNEQLYILVDIQCGGDLSGCVFYDALILEKAKHAKKHNISLILSLTYFDNFQCIDRMISIRPMRSLQFIPI